MPQWDISALIWNLKNNKIRNKSSKSLRACWLLKNGRRVFSMPAAEYLNPCKKFCHPNSINSLHFRIYSPSIRHSTHLGCFKEMPRWQLMSLSSCDWASRTSSTTMSSTRGKNRRDYPANLHLLQLGVLPNFTPSLLLDQTPSSNTLGASTQ